MLEDLRSAGRTHFAGADHILDGHRYARQRRKRFPRGNQGIHAAGLRVGALFAKRQVSVQLRVTLTNPPIEVRSQLSRRNLLLRQRLFYSFNGPIRNHFAPVYRNSCLSYCYCSQIRANPDRQECLSYSSRPVDWHSCLFVLLFLSSSAPQFLSASVLYRPGQTGVSVLLIASCGLAFLLVRFTVPQLLGSSVSQCLSSLQTRTDRSVCPTHRVLWTGILACSFYCSSAPRFLSFSVPQFFTDPDRQECLSYSSRPVDWHSCLFVLLFLSSSVPQFLSASVLYRPGQTGVSVLLIASCGLAFLLVRFTVPQLLGSSVSQCLSSLQTRTDRSVCPTHRVL